MNKIIKIFVILVLIIGNVFTQNEDTDLILKDSVEKPNCEFLQLILDHLIVDVQNEPNSIGYIVIFGSSDIIENAVYQRSIIAHNRFRNADKNRVKIITVKSEKRLKIETWLGKNGNKPEYQESELSMKFPTSDKPILFLKDMLDIVEIDGRLTYFNYEEPLCSVNLFLLSALLEANPNLNVEINIFAKKRNLAESVKEIIIREDIKPPDISLERINFKLGKKPNLSESEKGLFVNYFDRSAKGKYAIIEVNLVAKNSDN